MARDIALLIVVFLFAVFAGCQQATTHQASVPLTAASLSITRQVQSAIPPMSHDSEQLQISKGTWLASETTETLSPSSAKPAQRVKPVGQSTTDHTTPTSSVASQNLPLNTLTTQQPTQSTAIFVSPALPPLIQSGTTKEVKWTSTQTSTGIKTSGTAGWLSISDPAQKGSRTALLRLYTDGLKSSQTLEFEVKFEEWSTSGLMSISNKSVASYLTTSYFFSGEVSTITSTLITSDNTTLTITADTEVFELWLEDSHSSWPTIVTILVTPCFLLLARAIYQYLQSLEVRVSLGRGRSEKREQPIDHEDGLLKSKVLSYFIITFSRLAWVLVFHYQVGNVWLSILTAILLILFGVLVAWFSYQILHKERGWLLLLVGLLILDFNFLENAWWQVIGSTVAVSRKFYSKYFKRAPNTEYYVEALWNCLTQCFSLSHMLLDNNFLMVRPDGYGAVLLAITSVLLVTNKIMQFYLLARKVQPKREPVSFSFTSWFGSTQGQLV